MKYIFIKKNSESFTVEKMVSVLNVHRGAYYRWLKLSDKRSQQRAAELEIMEKIKVVQEKAHHCLGVLRVRKALKDAGIIVNHKKIARILSENHLNYKSKKKFRVTTDSDHNGIVSPNVLNRDFRASRPNQKWVSDITYIHTAEGWLYLCVIIDLYSRKVVAWALNSRMDVNLLLTAFYNAIMIRNPPEGLIFHSDRGSQYCAKKFRKVLSKNKMIQSMSRKGNCWDNACAETFFKSLKHEWLYAYNFKTRKDAKNIIFEYIEIFYNRRRSHSYLGYECPEYYELKFVA